MENENLNPNEHKNPPLLPPHDPNPSAEQPDELTKSILRQLRTLELMALEIRETLECYDERLEHLERRDDWVGTHLHHFRAKNHEQDHRLERLESDVADLNRVVP